MKPRKVYARTGERGRRQIAFFFDVLAWWTNFAREHRAGLQRMAAAVGLPPGQAEIAVQNVGLKFLLNPRVFSGPDAAEEQRRWFLAVFRHEAANLKRYQQRHPAASKDGMAEPRDRHDEQATDWENEERHRELLNDWLADLRQENPISYRLMIGHHIEGRCIRELAAEEGLSENAVRCRLHDVLILFRTRAARLGEGEADAP